MLEAVEATITGLLSDTHRGSPPAAEALRLDDARTAAASLHAITRAPRAEVLASRVAEAHGRAEAALLDLETDAFDAAVSGLPEHTWAWQSRMRASRARRLDAAAERHLAMRDQLRNAAQTSVDLRTTRIYAEADSAGAAEGWAAQARSALAAWNVDAGRLCEAVVQDRVYCEAERGATTLTELSDERTGVDRLLRLGFAPPSLVAGAVGMYRRAATVPITTALQLFVPAQFPAPGAIRVRPAELLAGGPLASLIAAVGAGTAGELLERRVDAVAGAAFHALTFDMGSFDDPFWYVKERGSAHDLLALVHEVGHVVAGRAVRRAGSGAWAGLLPDVLGESLAYTVELCVAVHDRRVREAGALREFLRHLAANALGLTFADHLYGLVIAASDSGRPVEGDGELTARAWESACSAAELGAGSLGRAEWLLVPGFGSDQNLSRLNFAAQCLALGAVSADPDRTVAAFCRLLDAWRSPSAFDAVAADLHRAAGTLLARDGVRPEDLW